MDVGGATQLVGVARGAARRDPGAPRRAPSARPCRSAARTPRRPRATRCPAARSSASSPRPPSRSAPIATAPGSPPTASCSPASTPRAASICAARCAPARPTPTCAALIRGVWQARADRGAEARLAVEGRTSFIPIATLKAAAASRNAHPRRVAGGRTTPRSQESRCPTPRSCSAPWTSRRRRRTSSGTPRRSPPARVPTATGAPR